LKTDLRLAAPYAPDALEALVVQFGSPLFVIDCELLRRQYHALAKHCPASTCTMR
jgi:diaminopimelate decarboxylase